MAKPAYVEIDGRHYLWRDILRLRQEQLAAARRAPQPALFELREDAKPAYEQSAARRFGAKPFHCLWQRPGKIKGNIGETLFDTVSLLRYGCYIATGNNDSRDGTRIICMKEITYYRHTVPPIIDNIECRSMLAYRPINRYSVIGSKRNHDTHDFSIARAVARDLSIKLNGLVRISVVRDIGTPVQSGPEYIAEFCRGIGGRFAA